MDADAAEWLIPYVREALLEPSPDGRAWTVPALAVRVAALIPSDRQQDAIATLLMVDRWLEDIARHMRDGGYGDPAGLH